MIFLCHDVADEDIKLNSNVFNWPDQIQNVFEVNKNRLINRREAAEEKLKKRFLLSFTCDHELNCMTSEERFV